LLATIYERRKLAREVLLGVLLLSAVCALWAWQYSASAIVRLTSSSAGQTATTAVDKASNLLTPQLLAAILKQAELYPEMVQSRGEASAIHYLRSRISLQPAGKDNSTGEVRVTYRSSDKATAIQVTNALVQRLSQVKPNPASLSSVDTAAAIDYQLQDSRSELKQFAARKHQRAKGAARRTSRHRTAHNEDNKPSVLEQTAEKTAVGSSPALLLSPEALQAKALQQQIKEAEARLAELRQRYTDQYPDVQDTQEQLQELRSQLSRVQAEIARSAKTSTGDDSQTARQEQQNNQARAKQEIQREVAMAEAKHEKSAESSTAARAYTLELDRYHALQRAQRHLKEYEDEGLGAAKPLFTVVQTATQAKAAGVAVSPLYWLMSLLTGLLAATLAVLLVPQPKTPPQGKIAVRSQFEREELAPQYRSGTR
jgi:hypothetical protein